MSNSRVSKSMFVHRKAAILFLGTSLLFTSCEDKFMKQTTADKTAAIATLQTKLDDSGNHIASFDPTKSETQLMRITSGAIAGAAVAIPPAALSIPVSIAVGEGVSLATSSFSQTLGITDNKINAGGPSVSFTASQDVVASNPMTLSIPFGSTSLNLNDVDSENIVVMYRWTIIENGETKFEAGILPGENVTRAKNKVSFQTTKFGTFQVGVAEKKISAAVVVKTEEPPALKSCERYAAELYPNCTAHGQTGCVSTDAFKAVDMTFLRADFILSSASIQNLQGSVVLPLTSTVRAGTLYGAGGSQSVGTFSLTSDNPALKACERYTAAVYQPCAKDGQVGCVTGESFKAADLSLIKPETILAGRFIAGIAGTMTLPSKDKVVVGTPYGPTGASIVGTSFADKPTLSYAGATGNRIKPTETFSVSPTSLIINGSNIIACGTKAGTTSFPAGVLINQSTCAITGAPAALLSPTTYKIVATNAVGPSTEADVTLAVLDTVATPTFSLAGGTYGPSQTVQITSTTPGAAIYYTTDGSKPTSSSSLYSTGVPLSTSFNLRAIATKNHFFDSAEFSASYVVDATPPSNPSVVINNGEIYVNNTSVTLNLSATDSTEVYITNTAGCSSGGIWETIGPSKSWTLGQSNTTATVYGKYRDLFGNETGCVRGTIIHDNTAPLTPVIADASKTFNASFTTSIQQNIVPDANFKDFRYTLDGTNPSCSSGAGSSTQPTSVNIPASTTILKAISCDILGQSSPVQTVQYTYNVIAPTVAISAPAVTNLTSIPVSIIFSTAVTGFDIGDLSVTNGVASSFSGSGTTYSAIITPITQGAVTLNIAENVAQDAATNGNIASTTRSTIYDIINPYVIISSTTTSNPTNNPSITLNFSFSESVTGFDSSDVTLVNATAGTFTAISPTNYTLQINATGPNITASIAASIAYDTAGNGNTAASPWSISFDNSAPTVAITSNRDPGPTNNSAITLTFTFSEPVTGFDATDVAVTNATKGTFTATSSTVYTLAITPTASTVSASVAANSAVDSASNGNMASTPWSITYDNSAPTVAITSNRDPGPTNNSAITLIFTFSEAVTGFYAADVSVTNATKGTFTATSSKVYTLVITAAGSNVTANVAANMANDPAGNGNTASSQWSITYDNAAPTVTITSSPSSGPTNNSAITLTFTFSEPVTGFTASDVALTNATAGTFTATSPSVYTLAITATGATVSASVLANSATDSATNGNIASTPWSIAYDATPPNAPVVTGATPTSNSTPTWTWTTGGGGNGTYRYKLNSTDLSTGATQTTVASYTPGSGLAEATHTLYVQERDDAGNWSISGSLAIQVVTPLAAPTLSTPIRYVTSLGLSWASVTGETYNLYWSMTAGVTTASSKISNVTSVYTHTPLSGGVTRYYKLAAVKNGIEGALSNEVSAAPYSYAAPTVTAISPSSGLTSGGTAVTISGTGFVSGATVTIGGVSATGVTFGSSMSLTATTPAGTHGVKNVVVTNPDGQNGALVGGYTYTAPDTRKVLLGGAFTTYNALSRNYIARLNSDGTLDGGFNVGSGFNGMVKNITIQSDGKILIGGGFTSYNGAARNYLARLNSDGTLDGGFNVGSGFNGMVNNITIQSDGKILIGGGFTSYNGTARNYLARLNSDGTLDGGFSAGSGLDLDLETIALQN